MTKVAVFARVLMLLISASQLSLVGCTEVGYVKPGVSQEQYAKDSEDCAEIAQQQASREYPALRAQWRLSRPYPHEGQRDYYSNFGPSLSELVLKYRRACMTSRGYKLTPLEEKGKTVGQE